MVQLTNNRFCFILFIIKSNTLNNWGGKLIIDDIRNLRNNDFIGFSYYFSSIVSYQRDGSINAKGRNFIFNGLALAY